MRVCSSEVAFEADGERVNPVVRGKQVRAQSDRVHRQVALRCPGERLLELVERPRPCERARRPADPDRRQLREPDALLDLHVALSAMSGSAAPGVPGLLPTASVATKSARVWDETVPQGGTTYPHGAEAHERPPSASRIERRAPVDVPGPDRDGDVAWPRAMGEERRAVLEPGRPARRNPGRASQSASTTSFPVTPEIGASRAG